MTETPPRPSRPRPLQRLARIFAATSAVLIVAAGLALIALDAADPLETERRLIGFERMKRLALHNMGLGLPGAPDPATLDERLKAHGLKAGAPVFLRIFKREFVLELWMLRDGRFHRFETYPICRWSGRLGPKLKTGDLQAPEGYYTVDGKSLNPQSRWYRSFNLGFPNAFDRAHGRTGSFLMVHGGCGSVGCYAMTNPAIGEIWRLVTAALEGGQQRFQVQVLPFRMTEANLARFARSPHAGFWKSLKPGSDLFEQDYLPPRVSVCGKAYAFEPAGGTTDGSSLIEARCPAQKQPPAT